jgi:hypothetical protein
MKEQLLLGLCVLFACSACGGSAVAPSRNSTVDGTWTGSGSIYRGTTSLPATLTIQIAKHAEITKTLVPLTGSWSLTFADSSLNKSGTLSMSANLVQDCQVNGQLIICHSSDPWVVAVSDGTLSSSAPCSSFSVTPSLQTPTSMSAVVGMNAWSGCDFNTSLNNGQFTLTRQ